MSEFTSIGKPILVASHPRSGTHLALDLLRKQFPVCASYKLPGQTLDRLYLALEALSAPANQSISESTALKILSKSSRPLTKTHSDPALSHLTKHCNYWLLQRSKVRKVENSI